MLIVQKFGGTSLADENRIRAAARKALRLAQKGCAVVTVVSAQGHTTDELLEKARKICPEPKGRELDALLSTGELQSAAQMAMAIGELGGKAVSLSGWQAGIQTDGVFGDARIRQQKGNRIAQELEKGNIVVVAGFQGVDEDGNVTTLGRGGSDTTAVALAAWLGAKLCRIYTDVDGVYDKDPRKYPDAEHLPWVSYAQMLAMARSGAQVLHDRSVELGQMYRVPIQVLSSFRPGRGTLVSEDPRMQEDFSQI